MQATFLGLLFTGIAALVAGVGLTRAYWRPDTPPYGRRTPTIRVMVNPGEYVRDAPLRTIQGLNLTGALLVGGAVVVLGYELVQTMQK